MNYNDTERRPKRAYLVSVYKGSNQKNECLKHLDELAFLSETFGVEVVGQMSCMIRKFTASTFVTEGKVEEIIEAVKECGAEMIIFDDEISPAQQQFVGSSPGTRRMRG